MNSKDQDSRNRIINAAIEMLGEDISVDKITVRQIADRANIGIGLINYHFKTKDNLICIAIGDMMAKKITEFTAHNNYSGVESAAKLKTMIKELIDFAMQYKKLMQFAIKQSLLNGDMQAPLFLIPILRQIFGEQKDEIQLRIIALQILLPLQVAYISTSAFHLYTGIDVYNENDRNKIINTLIDNLTL